MRQVLSRYDSAEQVIVGASPGGDVGLPLAVGLGTAMTGAFIAWKLVQSGMYVAGGVTAIASLWVAPKIAVATYDATKSDAAA